MQVSRSGVTLHLGEHYGEIPIRIAPPFIVMARLDRAIQGPRVKR